MLKHSFDKDYLLISFDDQDTVSFEQRFT
jgi:hypothetical protein